MNRKHNGKKRANLQRIIERTQAIKSQRTDEIRQADETQQTDKVWQADEAQQSGEIQQADKAQQAGDIRQADEKQQTDDAQQASQSEDFGKMPWGTVFVLAVLCVASLITGVVYWYNNYYRPSDHGDGTSVSEVDYILPSVNNAEQNQGSIRLPDTVGNQGLQETTDASDYPISEDYEPEQELTPIIPDMDPLPEFVELWEEYGNDEIVGILYLAEHEEIILQAGDNSFYLTHDIDHEPSETGSAFLDYSVDLLMGMDHNMVVYIPYGTAIRDVLREYINYDFFLMHPVLTFSTLYGDFDWEVFSFYIAPDTLSFMTVNHPDDYTWGEAVMHFTLASLYNTRLDVTEFDQIITIVSPTDIGSGIYYVLQARMLRQITS